MDFSHPNAKWVNDLVDELEDQETLTAEFISTPEED
jgi:hypothetical protein